MDIRQTIEKLKYNEVYKIALNISQMKAPSVSEIEIKKNVRKLVYNDEIIFELLNAIYGMELNDIKKIRIKLSDKKTLQLITSPVRAQYMTKLINENQNKALKLLNVMNTNKTSMLKKQM